MSELEQKNETSHSLECNAHIILCATNGSGLSLILSTHVHHFSPLTHSFNSAKYSAVVADIIGLFCFLTLLFGVCCPLNPERMAGLSCAYFLCCFFQGATFLIYRSNACSTGFFADLFDINNATASTTTTTVQSVSCSNGRGANLSITATVFYFICMCCAPTAVPPEPIGGNPYLDGEEDENES